MSTLMLYTTKYNTTKLYSGWIALKIDADLYEIDDFDTSDFKLYDTIILGLPVYMDKIKKLEFLIQNIDKLENKRVILFTVGAKKNKYIYVDNLERVEKYHFRGKLNFSELSIKDKILITSLKQRMISKDILLDEEREFLDFIKKENDFVEKKKVEEFLENFNLVELV
ncbi:MAG: flavodoxin domain-containing protein [Peptostreptococcaceae bacterium]